jgi:deoxyribodipyrimidine photolyase-related protein
MLIPSISASEISLFDPNDYFMERRLRRSAQSKLVFLPSPNFLNTDTGLLGNRKPYFQTAFYTQQRKDRGILLDEEGKPLGGQWTFDSENRKKIPKNTFIPAPFPEAKPNSYILEAIDYVNRHFPHNPGSSEMPFSGAFYPTTHAEAQAALDQFIQERMPLFGDYEDAIKAQEKTLFHSILSPLMNVGLLNPAQVVERVAASKAPLNSIEGFIRQVVGWREFTQLLYRKIGSQQRSTNYWQFTNEMPEAFYTGNTGVEPIDQTIRKLLKTGYNHHIERLGPVFVLVEIEAALGCLVRVVRERELHIGACADAFAKDEVLLLVVVAAAAGDKQNAQGLHVSGVNSGKRSNGSKAGNGSEDKAIHGVGE